MSEDQQSIKTAITEEGVMKEVIPLQERSFSNGMVITDLAYGKGEGEGASPGSRVTVNYISYRDGKIIDSKLDGSFKFRLGAKKVIKGLDVGINGMRIGDKRRLTIPPSMTTDGKEEFAAGKGKSYLICDVELVNIK
ncbi:hypothetical protein MKW98_029689 [Papaver atlanticum]|uniref:peptidylprolyl isomerase n=1 Tax=Papaver atlanticum TaxID=357466 RepID=A0AAD4T663_9MAGN|nr:hypothetical protein MKW98_029689 [Papaver atlanticum]